MILQNLRRAFLECLESAVPAFIVSLPVLENSFKIVTEMKPLELSSFLFHIKSA